MNGLKVLFLWCYFRVGFLGKRKKKLFPATVLSTGFKVPEYWIQSAGILDFAGKVTECKLLDFKARSRCFFTDLGLTWYFLRKVGADKAAIQGIAQENFVFLELRRRVERLNEIALETPAFATYKGGEIDFL